MAIYEVCFQNGIKLEMEWIPRSQNELANYIGYWMVDPTFFNLVNMAWGPHTADCFAASHNSQIAQFHSRHWSAGAEPADIFTINWEDEVCWLVLPVYLVGRAWRHAKACKANSTLMVAMWKSAAFWPLLCPDGVHLA